MLKKLNHIVLHVLLLRRYRVLRHMLLVLVMLLITVNVLWDEPTQIRPDRFGVWAIYFSLFAAITYTNMHVLVPRFLLKGKAKKYLGFAAILIVCFILTLGMLQGAGNSDNPAGATPAILGISSSMAAFSLFMFGLTALQLLKYRVENKQKIDALEEATMAVELANLQHQINPHFLFNMLNNANIMATEDSAKSAGMLSRLNELLRYQVNAGTMRSVRLADDIAFLGDYLALEKMRRDWFDYSIQQKGDMDVDVPPLLFIPFVENAVKHNPENDSYVHIVFQMIGRTLYFECRNPKARRKKPRSTGGGIGLANVRQRLDLLFKQRYSLRIHDEIGYYDVLMVINL